MPGHSHAAVASMESRFRKLNATGNCTAASQFRLKDTRDSSFYASVQNWMHDAINPCIESTYRFIGKVMDSVKGAYEYPAELYLFYTTHPSPPHTPTHNEFPAFTTHMYDSSMLKQNIDLKRPIHTFVKTIF
ncbi:hypothetical protein DPMN_172164 [Dreissena polymorpha]|uniref:Uncharacterized protein n=1 Tax=Dreissena polymorpha TaxID=45954 RepID=A0A9D4E331_DREPO|nr:hypothetical protein DPMN_172164 [Dreissena polymorpha]